MWKADRLGKHGGRLRKGDSVHVTKRLRTRSWEDRDGRKRQRIEVACFADDVILLAPAAGREPRAGTEAKDGDDSRAGEGGDDGVPQ